MRYAQIREMDVSNGEGIGISLFVQGCPFHCEDCFNPETWDFNGGNEWTHETLNEFFSLGKKPYVQRVSILGGEPLCPQNIEDIAELVTLFLLEKEYTKNSAQKKIWLYTGYTYEELLKRHRKGEKWMCHIFNCVDVLVEGLFEKEKKDLNLKFRGSSNQRVIDLEQMRKNNNYDEIIIKMGV